MSSTSYVSSSTQCNWIHVIWPLGQIVLSDMRAVHPTNCRSTAATSFVCHCKTRVIYLARVNQLHSLHPHSLVDHGGLSTKCASHINQQLIRKVVITRDLIVEFQSQSDPMEEEKQLWNNEMPPINRMSNLSIGETRSTRIKVTQCANETPLFTFLQLHVLLLLIVVVPTERRSDQPPSFVSASDFTFRRIGKLTCIIRAGTQHSMSD